MSLLTLLEGINARKALVSELSLKDECWAPLILGFTGSLAGLSIGIVLLRCYCRAKIERHFWHDDYSMIFATVCSIIVLGCFIGESYNGLGRHTLHLDLAERQYMTRIGYIDEIFGSLGVSAVKLSVGFLLLRTVNKANIRRLTNIFIGFLLIFTIFTASMIVFQCIPAAALWTPGLRFTSRCVSLKNYTVIGIITDSMNAAMDLILSTSLLPLFHNVKASKYWKLMLLGIVALGYIASGAAALKAANRVRIIVLPNTWRESDYTFWNQIELQLGILAASLPTINPAFTAYVSIFNRSTTPKSPTNSNNTEDPFDTQGPSRIPMVPMSPQQGQNRRTLHRQHTSCSTIGFADIEQQNIHRCPSSHYKAEVSISGPSDTRDERDAVFPPEAPFPAIMRTTDVFVHTMDEDKEIGMDIGCAHSDDQSSRGQRKFSR
ncbi:hypothetical protein AJ79_06276 [Helicocarpus griseus UAMH5409]|uniref:Rhodopsin domain-containing protein n=1 Tax=Helicocarpus griseus UAMH5409 TaxID=1447875 RepID=A0A2B7XFI5_9EURO|nr:hypothetical protein AJ79_06276 [Helicocarpus griseus UAMH5409]